jgi:hypothetical protein
MTSHATQNRHLAGARRSQEVIVMATLSIGQKAQRALQFLLALRVYAIASALAKFGFTAEDLAEGWENLTRLTHGRLDNLVVAPVDAKLVDQIDAWENVWFPVADAALASKAPEAHAVLFANLTQTSGPAVVVSVGTFIERIEKLDSAVSDGGLGRVGRAARQLLEKRGLTDEQIGAAKALLETATTMEPAREPVLPSAAIDDQEAERALWAWYLEWSSIARVAIKDRRLLRQCGFLRSGKSPTSEEPTPIAPVSNGAPAS